MVLSIVVVYSRKSLKLGIPIIRRYGLKLSVDCFKAVVVNIKLSIIPLLSRASL